MNAVIENKPLTMALSPEGRGNCRRSIFKATRSTTRPLKSGFCNPPVNMPEEGRDLLDRVNLGCAALASRNAKLLSMILLALRQLDPREAVRFEGILKAHDVKMVHAFISRFGAAVALFLLCGSLAFDCAGKSQIIRARTVRYARQEDGLTFEV